MTSVIVRMERHVTFSTWEPVRKLHYHTATAVNSIFNQEKFAKYSQIIYMNQKTLNVYIIYEYTQKLFSFVARVLGILISLAKEGHMTGVKSSVTALLLQIKSK